MELNFVVGYQERHQVRFSFNKFWGNLKITVDGMTVTNSLILGSLQTVRTWDFTVGVGEQHHVHIEKHREVLFAGFRPQPVYAYVDGQLITQGVA